MICDICKKKILTMKDMDFEDGVMYEVNISELPMPIKVGDRFYHISCYDKKDTDPKVKSTIAANLINDTFRKLNK